MSKFGNFQFGFGARKIKQDNLVDAPSEQSEQSELFTARSTAWGAIQEL